MFCTKCGIEIPGCVSICPVCGNLIEEENEVTRQYTRKVTSKLAIASLITGILSLLIPIALIPLVLGTLAINRIRVSDGRLAGHWMATVGSVMGVIALFIIPVMKLGTHAHDKLWQSSCASRLKQIGLATRLYSEDYDDRLPLKSNWSDSVGEVYSKQTFIFKCPMDKTQSRCSYSYNNELNGDSLSHIKNQEAVRTYFDSKGGWNSSCPVSYAVPRHADGSNFAFVDGHVKWSRTRKRHFFSFIYEFPFYMPRTINDLYLFERTRN